MRTSLITAVLAGVALTLLGACETTQTGRQQLQFLPDEQVAKMGEAAYAEMRKKEPIAPDDAVTRYVECVARAVTAVVPKPKDGKNWDVTVFEADQVNAFALPGGNIGVYKGMLKAARTPAQLAAVIGHEISHVQAEHANARLSTQYAADAGLTLLAVLAGKKEGDNRQAMALLGLGVQVGVLLPFNRAQESEADVLGLQYMAKAGFDPRGAVELWQNMEKIGGAKPPPFLSTHPADEKRIKTLNENMPQALQLYNEAQAAGRKPTCR